MLSKHHHSNDLTRFTRTLIFATLLASPAGCGDNAAPETDCSAVSGGDCPPSVLQGFLAGPIAGVGYETATVRGVTDDEGNFHYDEGEQVTFHLGETELGTVPGATEVTLFDLAGLNTIPIGNKAIEDGRFEGERKLERVINMAVMLQTLDADGDPENGVEISDEVRALFEGLRVDLSRRLSELYRDFAFRTVLGNANADGVFGEIRRLRNAGEAMNALYASHAVDPRLFVVSERRSDRDADGTPDSVVRSSHAPEGYLLREDRDGDNDGVVDESQWAEYDEDWFPVAEFTDYPGGPSPDTIVRTDYDAEGNYVRHTRDRGADGVIDSEYRVTYNMFGQPTEQVQTYEELGMTVTEIERDFYDERGNRTRSEYDADGDSIVDSVTTRMYNENDQLIRRETDEDGDATIDRVETYAYDENGNRTLHESNYTDPATPDTFTAWERDAAGNVLKAEQDNDGDGVAERVTTYEYDAAGRETRQLVLVLGATERETRREYDAAGNLTRLTEDSDGDGIVNYVSTHVYTEDGLVLERTSDFGADGVLDIVNRFTYDSNGNAIRETVDDGDGVIDRIVEEDYVPVGFGFLFFDLF